jgi:phage gp29-like protein
MADDTNSPALPPTGTIVTDAALYNAQINLYRNTRAFGGQRDPSSIWDSMLRDDGQAIPYYREIEEKDTDVANALDTLRDSVLKRDYWVTPADESSQAVEIAEFVEKQIDGLPDFHSILANLLDAPGYGFSLGEMVFDTSAGQASLIDVLDCPQELFLFGDRYQPQIGQLQFLTNPQGSNGDLVPEQKFIVYSYRIRSRNRMGRPLLRQVFWPSWFKRNVQRLWLRYCEKGPGTAAVRYPDAANEQEKMQAAAVAQALIENTAVAIPQNMEIVEELLKGARTIAYETYEHLYEACQLDCVRRILGETLTSFGGEKGKGTQALGNTHAETLDDKSVQLALSIAGLLNRGMIRNIVIWNYGPNAPMPYLEFDVDEEKDLAELLTIHRGLQSMGLAFSESYLRTTYSVPPIGKGDIIVSPSAAAGSVPIPTITPSFGESAHKNSTLRRRGKLVRGGRPARRFQVSPEFSQVFAEVSASRRTGEQQMEQFDELQAQLKDAADGLLKERVREVATALLAQGVS